MQKLISISFRTILRKLFIGEHFRFYDVAIIKALVTFMAALPQVNGIFNALKIVFEKEDALYKLSQGSILTKDIRALNTKRSSFITYFWSSVAIARYDNTPANLTAVETLEFLHNTYKDLLQANYYEMSGLIINFLEDCESATYKPSIQQLGLTDIVNKIKASEDEFDALYEERSTDKGNTADLGKLTEVRVEVDDAFGTLIDAINVTWTSNELGAKDQTVRTNLIEVKGVITNAISQVEINLARRGRHKKDDDKKDDGNQAPGTTNPPAPNTPPQTPDTSNPSAPDTPNQTPGTGPHPLDPNEHPSMGEH